MKLYRGVILGLGGLLAGCVSGAPAPVVEGKIQQGWQQANATAPAVVKAPAQGHAVQAQNVQAQTRAAARNTAAPLLQEENLENVQPAAGPSQGYSVVQVDAPTPTASLATYTVKETDTLFKIARAHNTTSEAIIRANGLRNVADVEPGRTLTIPANTKTTAPSLAASISDYLRTPPAANGAVATLPRVPLQQAKAPVAQFDVARIEPAAGKEKAKATPKEPAGRVHVVKQGETIYRLSKQYSLSILDIMAANDLERPEALKAGTKLNIPAVAEAAPILVAPAALAQKKVSENESQKPKIAAAAPTGLRPAADLGVTAATRATITASQTEAAITPGTRPANDPDKGTDTAETVRPLRPAEPVTEKDKLRAELRRGQIDRMAANQRGLIWPVKGNVVKKFGEKGNGVAYTGMNIAVPAGTPVLATEDGTVLYADEGLRAYGKMALIKHGNGMVSAYAHNGHLLVRKNERVQKGQVIAMSGQSGNVESPQLHFELRRNARAIDPLSVLP